MQLDISNNQLCGLDEFGRGTYSAEGIHAIADALRVCTSITLVGRDGLNISDNSLGDEGWGVIFAGICSSATSKIVSIDASRERIGPEGAKLIGAALRTSVAPSLTAADVRHNNLDESAQQLLRDAVKDRVGFNLSL